MAKAQAHTGDGSMDIQYERVERFSTPSILTAHFGESAIRNGKLQLWVSENVVKEFRYAILERNGGISIITNKE